MRILTRVYLMQIIDDDYDYSHSGLLKNKLPQIQNFILTRFNIQLPRFKEKGGLTDENVFKIWCRNRSSIFVKICLPSILNQTQKPSAWIILFDEKYLNETKEALDAVKSFDWIIPIIVKKGQKITSLTELYCPAILSRLKSDTKLVITSRLDNDDALSIAFCETVGQYVQVSAEKNTILPYWIAFPQGVQWDGKEVTLYIKNNNPFLSLVENSEQYHFEKARTAMLVNYALVFEDCSIVKTPATSIPLWLQYIHGENVSNVKRPNLLVLEDSSKILKSFGIGATFSIPQLSFRNYTQKCIEQVDVIQNNKIISLDLISDEQLQSFLRSYSFPTLIDTLQDQWIGRGKIPAAELLKTVQQYPFTQNYGNIQLSSPINWGMAKADQANLDWQLHSLCMLSDLAHAGLATKDNWYFDAIIDYITQWTEKNFSTFPPSPFSWDDHSTAMRLTNLYHVFLLFVKHDIDNIVFIRKLIKIIASHQVVLSCEDFYEKGTNHGLDQVITLYKSCIVLDFLSQSILYKKISLERLAYELQKSFASDGVHIENSPAYHAGVLGSSISINNLVKSLEGGRKILQNEEALFNSALNYLAYIVRPDGCYPPLGDSIAKMANNSFQILNKSLAYNAFLYTISKGKSGVDATAWHKVFPQSGYFIFRGNPNLFTYINRPHIVFKCGFLSRYHRHDDDNHLLIFAFGEEWLTDGGLYKHDHVDAQRKHLRSHFAHNVMAPYRVKASREISDQLVSGITHYSEKNKAAFVEGVTNIFRGYTYTRQVSYDGEFNFLLVDKIQSDKAKQQEYHQYWQIPFDKEVEIIDKKIIIKSNNSDYVLILAIDSPHYLSAEEIFSQKEKYFGLRSREFGKLETMHTIRVKYSAETEVHSRVNISFIKIETE
jgi:hypothetical protein